jgi:DNA mismatch repair protein MSH5
MLRHATPHSLLLLDEFGKGTSSLDGVAILASTIRAILRIGSSDTPTTHERPAVLLAPRSAITTHFTEALDSGILLDPAVDETSIHGHPKGVAYYHMQVMLHKPGDDRTDRSTISSPPSSGYEDSVVPLFKLVPGCASSSYGFACALQAGIPRVLIDRAADITRLVKSRQCILPTPAYLLDIKENKRMQDQISAAQRLLAITDWQKARETPVGAGSSVRELLSLLRDCMLV